MSEILKCQKQRILDYKYIFTLRLWCTLNIHGGKEEIRLNSDPWEMAEFTNWAKKVGKSNKIQCKKYILFRDIEEIFQKLLLLFFPLPVDNVFHNGRAIPIGK